MRVVGKEGGKRGGRFTRRVRESGLGEASAGKCCSPLVMVTSGEWVGGGLPGGKGRVAGRARR